MIIKHKLPNLVGKLIALPLALLTSGLLTLVFRGCRLRGLDGIGCRAQLVGGHMRHYRRLTSSICSMSRRAAQIPGRPHRVTTRRTRLRHRNLAARPCPSLLNGLTRTDIFGLNFLKKVQYMFRACGCPEGEKVVIAILERATTTDGDKSGVTGLGEDHVPSLSYDDSFCKIV
ncbi:MAG TPA: hypothetical protein VH590_00645 [Ktedonobacterales bacterium]